MMPMFHEGFSMDPHASRLANKNGQLMQQIVDLERQLEAERTLRDQAYATIRHKAYKLRTIAEVLDRALAQTTTVGEAFTAFHDIEKVLGPRTAL